MIFLSSRFISNLLRLLICQNEKFGAQIQKNVKELVGHELNPALFPILFDQIKVCVDKFFDPSGQVRLLFTQVILVLMIKFYCYLLVAFYKQLHWTMT